LVTLYVRGAKLSQLLDEAVCGVSGLTGSIVIPPTLYAALIGRFPKSGVTNDAVRQFLVRRSGVGFLKEFLERYPKMVTQPTVVSRPIARDMSALLIVKTGNYGLLPPEAREKLVQQLREHAEDYADVSFLVDEPGFEKFLTDAERKELIDVARNDLDRRLDEIIDSERDGYERSWEPSDWFDDIRSLIDDHRALFPNDAQVAASVERALKRIERAVEKLEEDRDPEREWDKERSGIGGSAVLSAKGRSTFDDLV
jgi:hypothetical protein